MKMPLTTEINVDELIQDGVFPVHQGRESASLSSMGGALRFVASKPANLMKLASALQELAIDLAAEQKIAQKAPELTGG